MSIIKIGSVDIFGYVTKKNTKNRYLIANLPKKSFFGDFEIVSDLPARFDVEARNNSEKGDKKIGIYQIPSARFKKICAKYPQFENYISLRST